MTAPANNVAPIDEFRYTLGAPDPEAPNGLTFTAGTYRRYWQRRMHPAVGSGWFRDRFLYLFGDGLESLRPCLEAWDFLVPREHPDRLIIGRNAYGALLVLEGAQHGPRTEERVFVLDPLGVQYWTDPGLRLDTMILRWFPRGLMGPFADDRVYRQWRSVSAGPDWKAVSYAPGANLELSEALAPIVPLTLGGEFELSNFQVEPIVEYYQRTGEIYRRAKERAER